MIESVNLNGKLIPHVREVNVRVETPADIRGIYREPTLAATINITRDASDFAITELFELATNSDGRKNILTDGTLDFVSDDTGEQYSFNLKKYFVNNWHLSNPSSPDAPTLETIEIKVGTIEFKAAGGGANFELDTFK
jgi:hypothetical protein